jgi:hypothetical protein
MNGPHKSSTSPAYAGSFATATLPTRGPTTIEACGRQTASHYPCERSGSPPPLDKRGVSPARDYASRERAWDCTPASISRAAPRYQQGPALALITGRNQGRKPSATARVLLSLATGIARCAPSGSGGSVGAAMRDAVALQPLVAEGSVVRPGASWLLNLRARAADVRVMSCFVNVAAAAACPRFRDGQRAWSGSRRGAAC